MVLIQLMRHEQQWPLTHVTPITAVSFYEVQGANERHLPAESAKRVERYINVRFREILLANPWLCGSLHRSKKPGLGLYLWYSEKLEGWNDPSNYMSVFTDDLLFEIEDWGQVWRHLRLHVPENAGKCANKKKKLCKGTSKGKIP